LSLSDAKPSPRYAVADRAPRRLSDFLLRWETILVVLLIGVVVVNALISPFFLDFYNLSDATFNFSEKAILALAMTLLIIVRDIDLSIAAIIALASLAMGMAAQAGAPTLALIAIGLAVGVLCGAFNGALVTGFGLPSIVVTIGDQAITKYPASFEAIGQGYISDRAPIPISFVLFLVLAVVFGIVLHRTIIGRKLFAIGANPVAALFSGIAVNRIRFWLFVLMGLMAGLAAVLLTGRIGSTRPNIALGFELEVVTMVVLGGVSIAGGAGTILGVALAVFVLGLTTFGLSLVNVPGIVISILNGALLIVSISAPVVVSRLLRGRT